MVLPELKQIEHHQSRIFTLLKVLSIFMVMAGHFFKELGLMWVPVTVGLLIFSFSSGYFTSLKYKGNFSKRKFWYRKFKRLGVSLLVINAGLFALFLFQGRTGVWSWQTIVNVIGFNGFLNWFQINDPSPFGAGMWFFTLLMLFYMVFPLFQKMKKTHYLVFTIIFILMSFYLNRHVNFGHALWLTASGFIIVVWAEKTDVQVPPNKCRMAAFLLMLTMVGFNFLLEVNQLNFFFILLFSLAGMYSCFDLKIPDVVHRIALFLSAALFEIYLIHSYMFITPTGSRMLDFIISLVLIVLVAKILSNIALHINATSSKVYK